MKNLPLKKLEALDCRISVYARYSSDMQSADSADDQIKRIKYRIGTGQVVSRKFIGRSLKIDSEWVLKDEAQSGRVAGREGYERLLEGIRSKAFDLLIVDDLSRLTRSLGNLLNLYEMLRWYEVELISICDGISSEDVSAKTFFTVKGMVNDFSNDIHAERVIRGMEIRALQGFSCGDHPFGYDSKATRTENKKGKIVPSHFKISINENEAQAIRRIFSMYDLGLGYSRIAKALNAEKIPSPGLQYAKPGKDPVWSPRSMQQILKNEKYVGIWRWKKTKVGLHPETKLRSSKERPLTEWVSHMEGKTLREDLRIIEQELWDSVQAKLSENQRKPNNIRSHSRWAHEKPYLPNHPLSGVLECGICASNLVIVGGRRGGYYGCSSAHRNGTCQNRQVISLKKIEENVLGVLAEKLKNPEMAKTAATYYNKAVKSRLASAPSRIKQIDVELERTIKELENLINFVIQGKGSESVNLAIKERETQKARLLSEGRALKRSQPKMREISCEEVQERITSLADTVANSPIQCYPVIRQMFPGKIKVLPKGKAVGGRNLFQMSGKVLLNGGLASNFERLINKNKGDAVKPRPLNNLGCVSGERGFCGYDSGAADGDRTRDIQSHNLTLYQLSYGRHSLSGPHRGPTVF